MWSFEDQRNRFMQLRKTALGLSLCSILYTGSVLGLGLGDITLKSSFNQPLNAEIKLIKVRDLSEDEILVALASREDFRRLGVERLFFLTGLKYEVVLDNPADPHIRVTSNKPVTEPYLNFLLDVQWPTGTVLREYTLLLDLPVYNQTPTAQSVTPAASEPTSPRNVVRETTVPTQASKAIGTYRVRTGDTMWEVAKKVRPNRSVTVNQTMVAIHQSNPDAFIKGNINLLRNGYVLQVPSANEIKTLSSASAVDNARRQMQTWATSRAQEAPASSTTEQPVQTVADSRSSQPEGRLILSSQTAEESKPEQEQPRLPEQSELEIAKQRLDLSQQETENLRNRVAELEAQIKTMEELVDLTKQRLELATESAPYTQTRSDGRGSGLTQNPGSQVPQNTGLDNSTRINTEASIDGAISTKDTTVIDKAQQVNENKLTEGASQTSTGFNILDFLQQHILAFGAALFALLLAIFAFFRLRAQPAESEAYYTMPETNIQNIDLNQEAPKEASGRSSERYSTEIVRQAQQESVTHLEDVIAEADIYFSLGQENKAIQLLQQEIEINPDNVDARLGLLKIFSNSGDVESFENQYAQLMPLGNHYINDQATALRGELLGERSGSDAEVDSDLQELDLDELALDTEGSQFDLESELNVEKHIASDLLDLETKAEAGNSGSETSQVLPFSPAESEPVFTNDTKDVDLSEQPTTASQTQDELVEEETTTTVDKNEQQQQDVTINEDLELDFLERSDQITTKLDLAKAYVDMNDVESAKEILEEVLRDGSDDQKKEAETLLSQL
jgi:pilus assembly protein FimV